MLINVNVESSKMNLRPRFPHIGIIGLVPDGWSGPWQTRHYVMSHLANLFLKPMNAPEPMAVSNPPNYSNACRRKAMFAPMIRSKASSPFR